MNFFRPFRENKSHERARGVERGRRRAEETEDNPATEPAGCGENGGASLRATPPAAGEPASAGTFWRRRTKGQRAALGRQTPGRQSRARRKRKRQPLACFPRPVFLAGNISFSLKPFPIDKALSDTLLHPLMRVSLYLPFTSHERRPVSVPDRIPGKPGARETPCGKRRRISFSLFIHSEKKSFY